MFNDLPPEDCAILLLAILAQRQVVQASEQQLANDRQTLATLEAAYIQNCGPLPVTP